MKTNETCSQCGATGPKVDFVLGRKLCLKCHAARVQKSRRRSNTLKMELPVRQAVKRTGFFDTPGGIDDILRENLARGLSEASAMLDFQKARLKRAVKAEDSVEIDEAARGVDKALSHYTALLIRLADKLESFEGLRSQGNRPAGVQFVTGPAPGSKTTFPA